MTTKLTSTHINALSKVSSRLAMHQKMNCTQLILNTSNQDRIKKAQDLISLAINELNKVV